MYMYIVSGCKDSQSFRELKVNRGGSRNSKSSGISLLTKVSMSQLGVLHADQTSMGPDPH